MLNLQETINKRVEEVKEDLELQVGYQLSAEQTDELRLTGRIGIDIIKFAPYLNKVVTYLNESNSKDVGWELALNTISGDFEITLKGCYLLF
ncbi:hypothetical protein H5S09_11210 [Limosilactobacillus sp. STM2_1]|uniref:Uncharacterized protein n=1 Tax=Limosilactobacillus rudii TaxID=2759755 RepID=A0A7W3YPF9_9LACO|nr:hypothetical protein [Limosilactobacillus rudii]MBB1080465.1 hypothetical protein [Limosilactobacillus rudii]MBB1098491.1 hypothetical protein [Limosilactobacillus rudii]MCD7135499.1 hypothetical protein [Limosilactobacillus rudii]